MKTSSTEDDLPPLWLRRIWLILAVPVVILLYIGVAILFAVLGAVKALIEEMPELVKYAIKRFRDYWDGDYE